MNRRHFLTATGFAATGLSAGVMPAFTPVAPEARVQLAIASYSYWHFREPKVSIESVIEKTAALGVAGVDVLHRQMDLPEKEPLTTEHRASLRRLKRHAFDYVVALVCLSTHQTFVNPDPAVIAANVAHTHKCIEICQELGVPAMRINTGRWGTTKDFDQLMKDHGVEPVLPGFTEDDGFKWCVDGLQSCLAKAAECGVTLALENHWGLARTADGLLRIVAALNSPWLGVLMDTGNFLMPPYKDADYEQLTRIASKAVYVQAKTYPGGGEWYSLEINYHRIARILSAANYGGWVALEMEGKAPADQAVRQSIKLLRGAFGG